ncbi:hypothetical protein ACFPOU_07640 [Massilia jejuensis]|uniref:Uncharacterized protein n=1 Tax=Massilia jejuensis TaxID=648894 RepID=A0ABW0PEA1_9BURK
MSSQIDLGMQQARSTNLFELAPCVDALLASARQDEALMDALAAADNMAMCSLLQSEWTSILAVDPEFAARVEDADPHVCDLDTLAELIALAPTSAIRQVLRETAYCREQMATALGLDYAPAADRAEMVLTGANAEWEILLGAHPEFSAWLNMSDRFTCSRATLIDAMLFAPTSTIRHVMRETFCFREIAAMTTSQEHK